MSITKADQPFNKIWLHFLIDDIPNQARLCDLEMFFLKLFIIDPSALLIDSSQGLHQDTDIIVSPKNMLKVLHCFLLQFAANFIHLRSCEQLLADKIVEGTQTAIATENSLFFKIHIKYGYTIQLFLKRVAYEKVVNVLIMIIFRDNFFIVYDRCLLISFQYRCKILQNYKPMQSISATFSQLTTLLNSLFSKEAIRRNNYFFNSMNERMELPIKTIAKERKVAQITNDLQMVVEALKQCPAVEVISNNTIRVLFKGDEVIVKLALPQGKKIAKKDVQTLTKQMKCQIKENHDHYLLQFQSHAATVQFVERVKSTNKGYLYEILQKNPYKCIEESINNYRIQKKNPKTNYYETQQYANSYVNSYSPYDFSQYYNEKFPIFIRRAVPSDDQSPQSQKQKIQNHKKYIQKAKVEEARPRFDSKDFPSFDKLSISAPEPKK